MPKNLVVGWQSLYETDGPYVYQPYGATNERAEHGRLFGVGGISPWTSVWGLTREEADAIVKALRLKTTQEVRGGTEEMKRPKKAVVKLRYVSCEIPSVSCPHCKTEMEGHGLVKGVLRINCWSCGNPIDCVWKETLQTVEG